MHPCSFVLRMHLHPCSIVLRMLACLCAFVLRVRVCPRAFVCMHVCFRCRARRAPIPSGSRGCPTRSKCGCPTSGRWPDQQRAGETGRRRTAFADQPIAADAVGVAHTVRDVRERARYYGVRSARRVSIYRYNPPPRPRVCPQRRTAGRIGSARAAAALAGPQRRACRRRTTKGSVRWHGARAIKNVLNATASCGYQ